MVQAPSFIPQAVLIQDRAASITDAWRVGPAPRPAWNRKPLRSTTESGYDPSESEYVALVTMILERWGMANALSAMLLQRAALSRFRDGGAEPTVVASAFFARFGKTLGLQKM